MQTIQRLSSCPSTVTDLFVPRAPARPDEAQRAQSERLNALNEETRKANKRQSAKLKRAAADNALIAAQRVSSTKQKMLAIGKFAPGSIKWLAAIGAAYPSSENFS